MSGKDNLFLSFDIKVISVCIHNLHILSIFCWASNCTLTHIFACFANHNSHPKQNATHNKSENYLFSRLFVYSIQNILEDRYLVQQKCIGLYMVNYIFGLYNIIVLKLYLINGLINFYLCSE